MVDNNRILVIDDDPGVRQSYNEILSPAAENIIFDRGAELFRVAGTDKVKAVARSYDLTMIDCGEQAISLVEKLPSFAVAFIDMQMPGLNGAETAHRIWEIDPKIKIVIVTAYSKYHLDEIIHITGRDDIFYLRKPFNSDEIRQFARALIKQWNLEREKQILSDKLARSRKNEISIASKIQQALLLGEPPHGVQGIQIAPLTIPSQEVDGDFYDFFKHNDHCLDIVLGDVMGKGIPAALVGAATKNYFLRTLYKLYSSYGSKSIPEPKVIVSLVKSEMIQNLEELETFVTLCYTRFDLLTSKLTLVDCGHMRTIHYQKEFSRISFLQGENMPIGFPELDQIKQISSAFKSGDLFFFYSDGLTEAQDSAGNLFGEERLAKAVEKNGEASPKEFIATIWKEIIDFSKTEVFADDFTCVVVRIE